MASLFPYVILPEQIFMNNFAANMLGQSERPASLDYNPLLPRRESYSPSPGDWRNEVLYALLPDRFSDGQEASRPLLDRDNLIAARPSLPGGSPWGFDKWAMSGSGAFKVDRLPALPQNWGI